MSIHKTRTTAALILTAVLFTAPAWALTQKEFMSICQKGSALDIAAALKDEGISAAKADAQGVTPLMMAVQNRGAAADAGKIAMLVNAGNKVNAQTGSGISALMYAAQTTDNPDVIIKLFQAGANVEAENDKGWTALSFAAARNPSTDVLEAIIDCGADVNASDRTGATPLMLAIRGGNEYAVIDALLKAGADPTIPDLNKRTCQSYLKANKKLTPAQSGELDARLQRREEIRPMTPERFALLCRRGSGKQISKVLAARTDPDAPVQDMTPLMWAARDNTQSDAVTALLQWGAEENARTKDGRTALIYAAKDNGNPQILSLLLSYGARADYRDVSGKNALDYANANPAFFPEDTLLLKAILEGMKDAEDRGAKMEKERQNLEKSVPELFPMTELYKKLADAQEQILKLSSELSASQAGSRRESAARVAALEAKASMRAELERQNQHIQKLTMEVARLQAEKKKELDQNKETTAKFTSLWQSELRKNLKLVEEMGLMEEKHRRTAEDLLEKIHAAEAISQKLAAEKEKNEELNQQKIAALEALRASEKQKLEDQLQNDVGDLNARLKAEEENSRALAQKLLIEENKSRQEILEVRSNQARLLGEKDLEYSRKLMELREQADAEKARFQSETEARFAAEAAKTADQLLTAQKAELSRVEAQYKIDLLAQQDRLKAQYASALAEMEHRKDEELGRKLAEESSEKNELRIQMNDAIDAMTAAIQKERNVSAALLAEKETWQAQTEKRLEELRAEQAALMGKAEADFRKRLEERENQLRSDFALAAAQSEAQHRQEMLKAVADLEAKQAEAIAKLKNAHNDELVSAAAKIETARTEALAQAKKIYDAQLEAAIATMESAKNDQAGRASAVYREESRKIRDLLEAAYTQSLEQAEAQFNKRLEAQAAQQKSASDAALELIRLKNKQLVEEALAQAFVERNAAVAQLNMEHQKELAQLREKAKEGWPEREKALTQRFEKELEELRASNQQANEKLLAKLKQEYDEKIKAIVAQKDLLAEEAMKKLEAHHRLDLERVTARLQSVSAALPPQPEKEQRTQDEPPAPQEGASPQKNNENP